MYEVEATRVEFLTSIKKFTPNSFLLVPDVGAQD